MRFLQGKISFLTLSLITLSGAHLVTHVFGRIHPALFPVFREEFQLSLQELGIIASIPPLIKMILYIPGGLLSDKIGQKTLIIGSFLASGVASLAMSFTNNITTLTIFLSILIASITFYHPPAYSLVSELSSKEKRGRALGIHGAGGTLGNALGPISLSFFIGYFLWNWRSIYFFWAIPPLLYTLAIWRLKTSPRKQKKVELPGEESLKDEFPSERKPVVSSTRSVFTIGVLGFMLFQGTRHMGNQIIQTFVPTYIHDNLGLAVADSSLIYGLSSLTGVIAAPMGGYLADRLGDKRWLTIALGSSASLLLFSSLTTNIILFSLLYWCSGFFNSSSMGAASSIIARSTPIDRRGLGYALYFLPGSIVGIISPLLGAYIADVLNLWSIFPVTAMVIALSLIVLKFGVSSTKIESR